jgi:hypothetical protein
MIIEQKTKETSNPKVKHWGRFSAAVIVTVAIIFVVLWGLNKTNTVNTSALGIQIGYDITATDMQQKVSGAQKRARAKVWGIAQSEIKKAADEGKNSTLVRIYDRYEKGLVDDATMEAVAERLRKQGFVVEVSEVDFWVRW